MRLPLALTAATLTALAGVLAGPAAASPAMPRPKPLMVGAAEDAAKNSACASTRHSTFRRFGVLFVGEIFGAAFVGEQDGDVVL